MFFDPGSLAREHIDQLLDEMKRRSLAQTLAMEPYIVQLADAGWTVPLHLSVDGALCVLNESGAAGPDAFFIRHYHSSFGSAFRELRKTLLRSEQFEQWRPLLRECFSAYSGRMYAITVPSLILVLEGAIVSLAGRSHTRISVPSVAASWIQQAQVGDWDWYGLRSIQRFVEGLFGFHSFGSERAALVNRHWVLHGRDEPHWNQADALRLFHCLAGIDVVAYFARKYSDKR